MIADNEEYSLHAGGKVASNLEVAMCLTGNIHKIKMRDAMRSLGGGGNQSSSIAGDATDTVPTDYMCRRKQTQKGSKE